MRVFGGFAGHRHGAFGHVGNRAGGNVGRRNTGLTPADQHAQADLQPFGAFRLFQSPAAHVDRHGATIDGQRIGGFGPGLAGGGQQGLGQIGKNGGHRLSL